MFPSRRLNSPWTPPAAPRLFVAQTERRHAKTPAVLISHELTLWNKLNVMYYSVVKQTGWVTERFLNTSNQGHQVLSQGLVTFGKFSGHSAFFFPPLHHGEEMKGWSLRSLPEKTNRNILWPACWPTAQERLKQAAAAVYFRMSYLNW